MPRKAYRPEEIIAKLRQAEVLLGKGKKVPEVVKTPGVHDVTPGAPLAESLLGHTRKLDAGPRLDAPQPQGARHRLAVGNLGLPGLE